jgi:hypothetical protein
MDITIVTSAKKPAQALEFLKELGFPFRQTRIDTDYGKKVINSEGSKSA